MALYFYAIISHLKIKSKKFTIRSVNNGEIWQERKRYV